MRRYGEKKMGGERRRRGERIRGRKQWKSESGGWRWLISSMTARCLLLPWCAQRSPARHHSRVTFFSSPSTRASVREGPLFYRSCGLTRAAAAASPRLRHAAGCRVTTRSSTVRIKDFESSISPTAAPAPRTEELKAPGRIHCGPGTADPLSGIHKFSDVRAPLEQRPPFGPFLVRRRSSTTLPSLLGKAASALASTCRSGARKVESTLRPPGGRPCFPACIGPVTGR